MREIAWRTPFAAFAPLAGEPWAALLHGGAPAAGWSVIAAFPAARLEARGEKTFVDGASASLGPFEALADLARSRRVARAPDVPAPFLTGLVGFAGYEMGARLEPSAAGPVSPFALPGMAFGAYDAAALFDRAGERAFIAARCEKAADRLEEALGEQEPALSTLPALSALSSNFSAEAYCAMVSRVVALIGDGAIFQANVSQQLRAELAGEISAFDIFRRLAALGAGAYGAVLQYPDGAIISNSPERFFRLETNGRILAEPIKGTRPRGADEASDALLAAELLEDAKERAENIMIADLTRNDLSRVCRNGSIREEAICALETGAHVHHLVSRISGRLNEGLDAVDALRALFPCGSITGAPKIEAMRTIAALEGVGRGPYCGAIGYIDDGGAADFAVAIRSLIVDHEGAHTRLTFPVGGGVTLRSDPKAEYRETMVKARGVLKALAIDEEALL